jgi:hypothetical protein
MWVIGAFVALLLFDGDLLMAIVFAWLFYQCFDA